MTEKQKKDKIRNLLAALRAAEVIKTDSPNSSASSKIQVATLYKMFIERSYNFDRMLSKNRIHRC